MKRKKNIYTLTILVIVLIVFVIKTGLIAPFTKNELRINNKTNDTLCIWFRPIKTNKDLVRLIYSDSFYPELIFPHSIDPHLIKDNWRDVVERKKGESLYLFDYKEIKKIKFDRSYNDTNIINNVVRLAFPMTLKKLDSCDWIITYEGK